jgi:hypothetical protein
MRIIRPADDRIGSSWFNLRRHPGHSLRGGGKSRRPAAASRWTLSLLVVLGFVLAMMLGVLLGRLMRMVRGMQAMGMRHMGVMTGLLMLAALVVLGGFAVMVGRALVVLGRRLVVLAAVVGLGAHLGRPVVGDLRREADASF